ncbi:MAG: hypothetical protein N3H30_02355 [Candidatus Micrarchaeota archaeon]|nr:hypothetical protein [Candidatus Micrarchaeota archaeon]
MVTVERKVEGGKLVRVTAVFRGDVLESVRITGDFFIHPEDYVVKMESELAGVNIGALEKRISDVCASKAVQCIGFSGRDIYEMLIEAYKGGKGKWA